LCLKTQEKADYAAAECIAAANAAALSSDASLSFREGGSAIGLACDLADLTAATSHFFFFYFKFVFLQRKLITLVYLR